MNLKLNILLAISVLWVSAASAEAVSLKALIDEALQNNPEIKASRERWEAAKAAIPQARSWEDPVLSVMFDKIPDSSI
ncbi:MAG: TolC family protein, partial [Deltaproteobacteria bacterium]